jgi:hypothetical protein
MHELFLSNMIFHSLSTLALFLVCALNVLRNPLRRREPRVYTLITAAPESSAPTRPEAVAYSREHALDLDLEMADAA